MNYSSNPFALAKTLEERELVWKSLKNNALRISKDEGERLMREGVLMQTEMRNR